MFTVFENQQKCLKNTTFIFRFQNMSKKALRTKQKYQDLRQKMKAKKAKRRQRLSYDF